MPPTTALRASSVPLMAHHDLAMLDLDGVVYRGSQPIAHAVETIDALRDSSKPVVYLTNNASRTSEEVAMQLRGFGLAVSAESVVTAGEAIARIVADALPAGSPVLVVGGPGLVDPLESHGLRCVASSDEHPVAVVQGFHPSIGWHQLAEASYAIQAGAAWFASNTDATFPTERGTAPGNGSLVAAVHRATGASCVVAGKPERGLFDETVLRTGAESPLMVGDRLDTDILGALTSGIDALLVLTGISGLGDVAALPPERRPHFVAPDLRSLLCAQPEVRVDGARTMCGPAVAEVDDNNVVQLTDGEPGSLEAVRAVVTAAWTRLDETGDVARPVGAALEH